MWKRMSMALATVAGVGLVAVVGCAEDNNKTAGLVSGQLAPGQKVPTGGEMMKKAMDQKQYKSNLKDLGYPGANRK